MQLPDDFIQLNRPALADEWDDFLEALQQQPLTSIRLHPDKTGPYHDDARLEPVSWNKNGRYLPERPVFTLAPAFHAGSYYVQEASSMAIEAALRQYLDLDAPLRALDLCAAPGGKTTLLASLLSSDSLLIANEVIKSRLNTLHHNACRWGKPNVWLSQHDSKAFSNLKEWFDLIVVDAPCSGEGLFRKTPAAIQEWSLKNVQHCSARQKRILSEAVQALAPGGFLLYCTCTYNQLENTDNAKWLESSFDLQHCPIDTPPEWGLTERERGYQFYPHKTKGEGFYMVLFQKPGARAGGKASKKQKKSPKGWSPVPRKQQDVFRPYLLPENHDFIQNEQGAVFGIPATRKEEFLSTVPHLPKLSPVLQIGSQKGKDMVPAPALALSTQVATDLPSCSLTKQQALQFLKKVPIEGLSSLPQQGWLMVKYEDLTLGWIKVLKNRINNYHPKEWRILMAI
jgi:16S rRNA C967 or C1407 C5-methylase (RsmB/RsmF family)